MKTRKKIKLAILGSHPIQYFSPLYRRLAKEENIDLTVYYCSRQGVDKYHDIELGIALQWDIPLLDGYNYQFLSDIRGKIPSKFSHNMLQPEIIKEIAINKYDALWIYGYKELTYLLAMAAAKIWKTSLFIRGDTNPKATRLQQRTIKNIIRKPLLKLIYMLFDGALAIGKLNADHYRAHGMSNEKIFMVPYAVDNELFMSHNNWGETEILEAKKRLSIPLNMPVILYVGKFTPNKDPFLLLDAFRQLQQKRNITAALVLVGEGGLRPEMEQYCNKNNLKNVIFTGFVNQSQVINYYVIANIFVLFSKQEAWGLVINEAMCTKNAVIVSEAIGAAADLIVPGKNGYIIPVGDVNALTDHLETLVSNQTLCHQMGENSLELIMKWSFEEDVSGVLRALSGINRNYKQYGIF